MKKVENNKRLSEENTKLLFYIIFFTLLFVTTSLLVGSFVKDQLSANLPISYNIDYVNQSNTEAFIPLDQITTDLDKIKSAQQVKLEEEEKQRKIDRIEALFARSNSPMSGFGALIYKRATECGGDYRVIVGIAGNESGFGRIPYKTYNPFGYLDGVQYESWAESINYLSCKISQQFLVPCNNDLNCIINRYAGPSDSKELWISNVSYFISQL